MKVRKKITSRKAWRIPSGYQALRSQYVRRAEYLLRGKACEGGGKLPVQEHKQFLEALHTARDSWNETFPEYTVDADQQLPSHLPEWVYLYPAGLVPPGGSEPMAWRDPVRAAAGGPGPDNPYAREHSAIVHWQSTVMRLCVRFWPLEHFPRSGEWHPASRFVSAALLSEQTADPELILHFKLAAWKIPLPEFSAEGAYHRAFAEELLRRLENVVPAVVLNRIEIDAVFVALRAQGEAEAKEVYGVFVPVLPGFTKEQWIDMAEHLASLSQHDWGANAPAPVVTIARRLYEDGEKSGRIAARLGVAESTVRGWLGEQGGES